MQLPHILSIDRWSRHIGLAHSINHQLPLPLGTLTNNTLTMWDISVLLQTHHITQIVIGYPSKQLNIQKRIDAFVVELSCITELPIVRIDEDYTTTIAKVTTGIDHKSPSHDIIAAMIILDRYLYTLPWFPSQDCPSPHVSNPNASNE